MVLHKHLLSLSYKCVTWQTYAQQITFSSVSLKIGTDRLIMKLGGKNIISVFWRVSFYDNSVFKRVKNIFNLRFIIDVKLAIKLNFRKKKPTHKHN